MLGRKTRGKKSITPPKLLINRKLFLKPECFAALLSLGIKLVLFLISESPGFIIPVNNCRSMNLKDNDRGSGCKQETQFATHTHRHMRAMQCFRSCFPNVIINSYDNPSCEWQKTGKSNKSQGEKIKKHLVLPSIGTTPIEPVTHLAVFVTKECWPWFLGVFKVLGLIFILVLFLPSSIGSNLISVVTSG